MSAKNLRCKCGSCAYLDHKGVMYCVACLYNYEEPDT